MGDSLGCAGAWCAPLRIEELYCEEERSTLLRIIFGIRRIGHFLNFMLLSVNCHDTKNFTIVQFLLGGRNWSYLLGLEWG